MDTGSILAERYRLISLLGRGGMGEVWRAEHLGLRAPVAVKLMGPAISQNQEALQRFNREAQAAAALRSPHVVQILDHGVDPATGTPFIAMELMEGESLAHRIARVGRLSPQDTARIVTHVARALSRAHEGGIVHRDLKPDNVFLVKNEDEEIAKVLDFGIAKANSQELSHGVETRTGAVMGTPYYMSPEQIGGSKSVDHRTDLWALGVIACECLTGHRPFEADSIGALVLAICTHPLPRPSLLAPVAPEFDAWFARAVERDPALRFQTARELADALRRALAIDGGAAPTPFDSSTGLPPAGTRSVAAASVGALSVSSGNLAPPAARSSLPLFLGVGAVLLVGGASAALWLRKAPDGANLPASAEAPVASKPPPAEPPAPPAVTAGPDVVPAPNAPSSAASAASSEPVPSTAPTPEKQPRTGAKSGAKPSTKSPAPAKPESPAKPASPTPKAPADSGGVFDRRKG